MLTTVRFASGLLWRRFAVHGGGVAVHESQFYLVKVNGGFTDPESAVKMSTETFSWRPLFKEKSVCRCCCRFRAFTAFRAREA